MAIKDVIPATTPITINKHRNTMLHTTPQIICSQKKIFSKNGYGYSVNAWWWLVVSRLDWNGIIQLCMPPQQRLPEDEIEPRVLIRFCNHSL